MCTLLRGRPLNISQNLNTLPPKNSLDFQTVCICDVETLRLVSIRIDTSDRKLSVSV